MDFEDLFFWLFLGFALLSRVFAWIVERVREQQGRPPSTPPAPGGAGSTRDQNTTGGFDDDDFLEDSWDQDPWAKKPEPVAPPALPPASKQSLTTRELRPRVGISQFHEPAPVAMTVRRAADEGRRLRQQLGLDRRSSLQRSILLMTVLGPCRANAPDIGKESSRD
ncbi:MAG: hypothetical protein ACO3OV_03615 [Steroidobacteraceae bacterium]|nr:hypothetical protein [Gammaproteobacteria bacterium]